MSNLILGLEKAKNLLLERAEDVTIPLGNTMATESREQRNFALYQAVDEIQALIEQEKIKDDVSEPNPVYKVLGQDYTSFEQNYAELYLNNRPLSREVKEIVFDLLCKMERSPYHRNSSNPKSGTEHPFYKAIVSIGEPALPHLFRMLNNKNSNGIISGWQVITSIREILRNAKIEEPTVPEEHRGRFSDLVSDFTTHGKKLGYING